MLSALMDGITSDPGRYGCQLWNYRISGNTMELRVSALHADTPEDYREGVIRAGQVLEAVDYQVQLSGQAVQVNSFPDLENSQLIALVRIHDHNRVGAFQKVQRLKSSKVDERSTALSLMKSIASHYGLFFHQHNKTAYQNIREQLHADRQRLFENGYCYSLCTVVDNPFVWIRTGQWIERVFQLVEDNPAVPEPVITCKISKDERSALNEVFADCAYVQAVVQIPHPRLIG